MWLYHKGFETIVRDSWRDTWSKISLDAKVRKCGPDLLNWASKEFGSIRKQKKELTETLKKIQNGPQTELSEKQLDQVERELDSILEKEESIWCQRSKALWLKEGDKNSSFFHQKASNRKRRNTIKKH